MLEYLWRKNEPTQRENRPSSSNSHREEAPTIEDGKGKRTEITIPTGTQDSSEDGPSSSTVNQREAKPIEIDGRESILSIACLADRRHVVSGGREGKIRRWRAEDGKEVGTPMDAGESVFNTAVSRDGKWVVSSGTDSGRVTVWNALSHEKVAELKGHNSRVCAVDVSPDGTRIATGSEDKTACVWSLSTGQRLLGPWPHDYWVVAAKFSPNGRRIATAAWWHDSLRIYDTQNGRLLVDFPVRVNSLVNQSFAWVSNSDQLFALSRDGNVICLDVSTRTTHSRWSIHSSRDPKCIALASDGKFIAASANSTVSFWDTSTHKQIGPVIHHTDIVMSMAISASHALVTGAGKIITIRRLWDILPSPYFDDTALLTQQTFLAHEREICRVRAEKTDLEEEIESLRAQHSENARLKETVQRLSNELAVSQRAANQKEHSLNETIESLRARDEGSNTEIADLKETVQQLRNSPADSQHKTDSLAQIPRVPEQNHQGEALYAEDRIIDAATSLLEITDTVSEVPRANKAAAKFKPRRFSIYQAICDILEEGDRVTEAIEYFKEMQSKLAEDAGIPDERAQWELDFRGRCAEKLAKLGDIAMDSQDHDEAIKHYSDALTLEPTNQSDILLKRSKVRAVMGSWEEALADADKVIELDLSSYKGYESKHAALQGMGRHRDAFEAFKMMLSKLEQSPDPHIRELRRRYLDATPTIQYIVEQTIRQMPRVLIDPATGHLHNKTQQAAAFEERPIYHELRSSMTTQLDEALIWREVKKYYRYVMFSHRWENGEPLLQEVEHISIYELESSSPNIKLQTLCELIRSLGFHWVWSDTCCIDKKDNVVLQESLVAMFTWYRSSSLTIVYLRGVWSQFQKPGDLRRSIWNTRAWTYQEYVAAEIVQFYTEDWKPYLGLEMYNHKKSRAVISEMQQATGTSTQELVVLRPGLERVREKLYLASMRATTLVEDIAYSLLGIFNVAIPVIYGERNRAVGRLLEHILTGSGDVTILAWTGRAGDYNSCLPPDLTVYNKLVPPHVPRPIEMDEMISTVAALCSSSLDLSPAATLYERLKKLPSPSIASSRLRLSGIVFPVTKLVHTSDSDSDSNLRVYRATTAMLGDVEIKTTGDLSASGSEEFLLVHPWISPLLNQDFARRATFDETTRALRLVARLRQPFGALLLVPVSHERHKRVAADSLIMAQIREGVSLQALIDSISTVDVQ